VVDDDPRRAEFLASQVSGEVRAPCLPSIEELRTRIDAGARAVVIFGPSFGSSQGVDAVKSFLGWHPNARAVLTAATLSNDLLQRAIRSGLSDVVAYPSDQLELLEAVDRAVRSSQVGVQGNGTGPVEGFSPTAPAAPPKPRGRLITVIGAKGGSGKSVVACNLAVALRAHRDRPVCLLDGNFQFPDGAMMLGLEPETTIYNAVALGDRLDADALAAIVQRDPRTGVDLLTGPADPVLADSIDGRQVLAVVEVLQELCAYVVADSPPSLTDTTIELIAHSQDVLVVVDPDMPSIKNVTVILATLDKLGIRKDLPKLVINRFNSRGSLDMGKVRQVLKLEPICVIPVDDAVPASMNGGPPLVVARPDSPAARSLLELGDRIIAATPLQP
jgi:pilus assembly protein CpaE